MISVGAGMKKIAKKSGSMTVFFCLVLVMISALICTCLESARTVGLRFMAQTASDSSLQSVFADYHRKLWEDYHVFFHYEQQDMTEVLEQHLEYYTEPGKGLYGLPEAVDLWGLSVEEAAVTDKKTAVSDGGRLFLEQAVSYEQYQIAENALKWLLDQAGILDEVEKIRSFAVRVSECFEQIQQAGILYQEVRDGIGAALELGETIIKTVSGDQPELTEASRQLTELTDCQQNLLLRIQRYQKIGEDLGNLARTLSQEYGGSEDSFYEKQLRQLLAFGIDGILGRAVDEARAEMEGILAQTAELLEAAVQLKDVGEEMTQEEQKNRLSVLYDEMAESMDSCISLMQEQLNRLDAASDNSADEDHDGSLEEENGDDGGDETETQPGIDGKNLFELVGQWKNMAVLSLAMGERASETRDDRFSLPELLPSRTAEQQLSEVSLKEKGLFVFYLTDTFTNGRSEEQKNFAYQQEYLLFGKQSSRSNLSAMADTLLAVREGLNLAFLLSDQKMGMAAKTAAYALVGATGLYPLMAVTRFLILAAWAFAESVYDLRQLFDGKKVPVWKTEADWKTSLGGLVSTESSASAEGRELKVELSYEDYLKLFLFTRSTGTLCLRAMDVIQRETEVEQPGFLMEDCCGSAQATVSFSSPYRLITLPLIGTGPGRGHRISVNSSYQYQ